MNYIQKTLNILSTKIEVDDDLLDLYTLLVLTRGINTELVDVHKAWSIWMNRKNRAHKSLIPFSELPVGIQELDQEYLEAIKDTAKEILS